MSRNFGKTTTFSRSTATTEENQSHEFWNMGSMTWQTWYDLKDLYSWKNKDVEPLNSRVGLGAVAVVALLVWTSLQMVTHGRRQNCNAQKDRHLADHWAFGIGVFHVLLLMSFDVVCDRRSKSVSPGMCADLWFMAPFCVAFSSVLGEVAVGQLSRLEVRVYGTFQY